MALRAPLFTPPNLLHRPKSLKPHTTNLSSFTSSIPLALNTRSSSSSSSSRRRKSQFSCCTTKKKIIDVELAIELAAELAKINKSNEQRKEAILKSRQLLFGEFCQYLGLRDEKVKKKWRKMDEVEKMGCVQKFVSEWSLPFHPLSAKSVKEMVEEYLKEDNPSVVSEWSLPFNPLSAKSVKEMVEEHLKEENPSVVSYPSFMLSSLKIILAFLEGFLGDDQNGEI